MLLNRSYRSYCLAGLNVAKSMQLRNLCK